MQPDSLSAATDGVFNDDGSVADRARFDAKAKANETAPQSSASEPATPAAPVPLAEVIRNSKPPDLNVPGLPELPPEQRPPERVTDYNFPMHGTTGEESMRAAVEVGTFMQQAGIPVGLGSLLANAANRVQDVTGGSDADFDYNAKVLTERLRSDWGDELFTKRQAALGEMVDFLDRKFGGKVLAFLDNNPGVLLDPIVLGSLMLHAEKVRGRLK